MHSSLSDFSTTHSPKDVFFNYLFFNGNDFDYAKIIENVDFSEVKSKNNIDLGDVEKKFFDEIKNDLKKMEKIEKFVENYKSERLYSTKSTSKENINLKNNDKE